MKETLKYTINPENIDIIILLDYLKNNLTFNEFYILVSLMNSELNKNYCIQKEISERGEILIIKEVEEWK